MGMVKTYRRDGDGTFFYREAWNDRGVFVRHEGKVGTKGKRRNSPIRSRTWRDRPTATEYFRAFREETAADGFAEVPDEEHGWVVLQLWTSTSDLSDPADAWILDEGEEALNNHVGWLGVGRCDGNDIGGTPPEGSGFGGTVVNLFCLVVDVPLGVRAVRAFARKHELTARCVIGAREPGEDSPYVLAWSPRKRDRTFAL